MELATLLNVEDLAQEGFHPYRESLEGKQLSAEHLLLVDLRLMQLLSEGVMKRASDALQTAAPHVPPPQEY